MEERTLEFVQLHDFTLQLERTGDPSLLLAIETALLNDPEAGVLLRGGIRKLRLGDAARNSGKRGGYRVWHYYYVQGETIFLLYLLDKREAQNISKKTELQLISMLSQLLPKK